MRRNAVFALGVQLSGALFTGAMTLFLVRALGPEEFGIFAVALAVSGLILLPSDFGVSQSAARFIAERRGNPTAVGEVLGDALTLKLIGSSAVSAALFAAAAPIAELYGDGPNLVWPLRWIAIAVFAQSVMTLFTTSFVALGRTSISFRLVFSESAVEAGATVALVLLGTGVAGASLGRAVGFAFGALGGVYLMLRLLGRRSVGVGRRPGQRLRRLAGYAGALFIIDGAWALYSKLDVVLIGAILGAGSAGVYAAPVKVLAFVAYPSISAAAAVAPRLARHERHPPDVPAFHAGLRYLIIVQFPITVLVLVWAEPITSLVLGSGYAESAGVMRALAPWVLLSSIAPMLALGVNYLGEARRRIPLAIGAVVIDIAILLALIDSLGVLAGAIGTDIALFVYVLGHLHICRGLVGLEVGALLLTTARSAVAAGAMATVLLAVGTSGLAPGLYLVAGAGGLAAYLAMIVLAGEVSLAELSSARRILGSVLGRPAPPAPVAPATAPATPVPGASAPPRNEEALTPYLQGRGPSLRRFPGFLLLHASCGGGFDIVPAGDPGTGAFVATCLGCGKRFEFRSQALEPTRGDDHPDTG